MTGVIKRKGAGFGFIKADDGQELFFTGTACAGLFDGMVMGQRVEFQVTPHVKGPRAVSVRALDEPDPRWY